MLTTNLNPIFQTLIILRTDKICNQISPSINRFQFSCITVPFGFSEHPLIYNPVNFMK